MGHLPIVNQETVTNMMENGCISTRGDLKKKWIKTTSDIFSDVLAVRNSDLVFPWITKSKKTENLGFKYVFKVAGPPFFAQGEEYPVCVPLERDGLEYENPLSEAEALDLWNRKLLWNVIGKKSLGRGRSLTHQTPMEDKRMIELLNMKNRQRARKIKIGNCAITNAPITIDPSQDSWDANLNRTLTSLSAEDRLSRLELSGLPWRKGKLFVTEKTLEAWMMENIDKAGTQDFRELLFMKRFAVTWFANYIPFGVQGSNMDIAILQEEGERKIGTVVELKVNALNKNGYQEAASQVVDYAIFIKKAFHSFGITIDLNTAVLSGASNSSTPPRIAQKAGLSTKWITYEIDNQGSVSFKRLL